jgi:hypothetical protein
MIERNHVEAYRSITTVEHTIEFGGHPLFDVVITTRGSADLAGVKLFGEELMADPRFRAGSTILVDHSELDARPLTASDLSEIGRVASGRTEQLGDTVFAIVVPNTLTFGMARQSSILAGPLESAFHIFYSRDEAEAWLRAERRGQSSS